MKIQLVIPDFENEHLFFEKSFSLMGFECQTTLYQESDFLKPIKFLEKITLFLLKKIIPAEWYKERRFNRQKFMSFISKINNESYEKKDILFIVKPYLYQENEISFRIKNSYRKVIFFHYDTLRRFPIDKEILNSTQYLNISFDINDAKKYKLNYSPIPRSDESHINYHSSKYIYFYGSFSIYRLVRLIIAKKIFNYYGIRTFFYLRNIRANQDYNFLGIFISNKYRIFHGKGISLDIPQAKQNGASFRSSNFEKIVLSYSSATPYWRHINSNFIPQYIYDCIKFSKILKNNLHNSIFLEEKNMTHSIFKKIFEKYLNSNT